VYQSSKIWGERVEISMKKKPMDISELEQTNKKKEDWERMLSCLTSTRML